MNDSGLKHVSSGSIGTSHKQVPCMYTQILSNHVMLMKRNQMKGLEASNPASGGGVTTASVPRITYTCKRHFSGG